MGLSLEASEQYRTTLRPRHFDSLEVYHPADGAVLWQIHLRKKNLPYYLFRYTYRALNWLLRLLWRLRLLKEPVVVKNPLPFEVMGIYDDEVLTQEACRHIAEEARKAGVRVGLDYGPLEVNKTFPLRSVRWGGLTNPGAWLFRRERAPVTLYLLVPEAEHKALLAELDDWRVGRRDDYRETLGRLRRDVEALRGELTEAKRRLSELERGRFATRCSARPH